MVNHYALIKLHKASILGDSDYNFYSYISMPEYLKEANHCDAIIYNKKFNMYQHQIVTIQYKNKLTKEMAAILGFNNYSKFNYYTMTELVKLYNCYKETDLIVLNILSCITEQTEEIRKFNELYNIEQVESKFAIADLSNYTLTKKPYDIHLNELRESLIVKEVDYKRLNYIIQRDRARILHQTSGAFIKLVKQIFF
jgi:hypothetical protein